MLVISVAYSVFLTKPLTSGILFSTAITLDFVAKLVISGFDSADLILFTYFRIKVRSI